jgi:RNA polymerase sigma-70 factor (ECF subfamily)
MTGNSKASPGAAALSALLLRAADGDAAAFQQFYDNTSAKLFGIIVRILPEGGEAEDVLQEVYVTIWRKAAEFDPARASPITWVATIARNRAIDRVRARGTRPQLPVEAAHEVADTAPDAEALYGQKLTAQTVHGALAQLEPRHAEVIRACYFEGLTYEELASREGVPVGTLKSWVRRGLMKMRDALGQAA